MMISLGFGTLRVTSHNTIRRNPLLVVQRGPPGPNPSTFFSHTGGAARREDKPPFKQQHQKGDDGGDCRTFTSDLLSGQVKYPQGLDEY
jgi:hypothetical protein